MQRGRRKLVRCILALAGLFAIQSSAASAAEQVDLLLVLSSDVSRSVDHPKFLLQREGYATAISDPHVMDAIKSGPQQRIAVCFVEWSGFGAQKLVIDWAIIDGPGDGTNNAGRDVKLARDETIAKGIVINGLVILSDRPVPWNAEHTNPPGGLEKYYQDNVIGGPGAFVLVAENFNSFGRAIIKKLIAEIAALSPASHPASHIVVR